MILCGSDLAERVDRAVFPFTQSGAQMHTIAAKAVAFGEASTPAFAAYTHRVVANARVLAAALAAEGLVVTTGGTDTHLLTADPAPLGVDGRTARGRLAAAGLVLDCCALPHGDARGLRLGTAAVTTQGMGEAEMGTVAGLLGGCSGGTSGPPRRGRRYGTWPRPSRRIRAEAGYAHSRAQAHVQPSSLPGSLHPYARIARVWG